MMRKYISLEIIQSYLLKFISLELWIFSAKVVLVMIGLIIGASFVQEGNVFADFLMRRPYRWDFETMIASIYIVWGYFLWKASQDPENHKSLIYFTIYANMMHGFVMIIQAMVRTKETARLLGDAMHLFLPAVLVLILILYKTRKDARKD